MTLTEKIVLIGTIFQRASLDNFLKQTYVSNTCLIREKRFTFLLPGGVLDRVQTGCQCQAGQAELMCIGLLAILRA